MKRVGVVVFVAVHLILLIAAALLPYSPSEQNRAIPFSAPPQLILFDDQGRLGPFVLSRKSDSNPSDGTAQLFRVRLLDRSKDRGWVLLSTESPSGVHLLGTDRFGRDVLSRVVYAARFSLLGGVAAATLAVLVGLIVASLSTVWGRAVDSFIGFLIDTIQIMPWIFLLIALRALLPQHLDVRAALMCTLLLTGFLAMAYPARLARSAMKAAAQRDFVAAAVGFGATRSYVVLRHLVPFALDRLMTHWALLAPNCVMAEVLLSYFGLGAEDARPSLGNLLSDLTEAGGALEHPWMYSPVVVLVPAVLSYHLLAEALRPSRQ